MGLFKSLKRPRGVVSNGPQFSKLDITKVNLPRFESYLSKKITEYLQGVEDDVTIALVQNSLSAGATGIELLDMLSPILGKANASEFVTELWNLLVDASSNSDGVPSAWKIQARPKSRFDGGGLEEAIKLAKAAAAKISKDGDSKKSSKDAASSISKDENIGSKKVKTGDEIEPVQVWFAPDK
jgi:hypothetical protein